MNKNQKRALIKKELSEIKDTSDRIVRELDGFAFTAAAARFVPYAIARVKTLQALPVDHHDVLDMTQFGSEPPAPIVVGVNYAKR